MSTLTPAVLDFIWSDLDRMESPFLEDLADRLETEVVVDEELPRETVEFPGKGPGFRNDVMIMALILRTKAKLIKIEKVKDFGTWVKTIIGTDLSNDSIHDKLTSGILAENADHDPDIFRLALGRILARAAFDRVVTYHVETMLISPPSCAQNLFTILKSVADGCVFTKLRT